MPNANVGKILLKFVQSGFEIFCVYRLIANNDNLEKSLLYRRHIAVVKLNIFFRIYKNYSLITIILYTLKGYSYINLQMSFMQQIARSCIV